MKDISIKFCISQTNALAAGASQYGAFELKLTDQLLEGLTQLEREIVGRWASGGEVRTDEGRKPTSDAVDAFLRRQLDAHQAALDAEAQCEADRLRSEIEEFAEAAKERDPYLAREYRQAMDNPDSPEDLRQLYRDAVKVIEERKAEEAAKEAHDKALKEKEKAKLEMVWAQYYKRLPATMRARDEDRLTSGYEIKSAIVAMIIDDAGLSPEVEGSVSEKHHVDDDEYAILLDARKAAPKGAKCTPVLECVQEYRKATEDDDPADIDDDGDVLVLDAERFNVKIEWTVAGRGITAYFRPIDRISSVDNRNDS